MASETTSSHTGGGAHPVTLDGSSLTIAGLAELAAGARDYDVTEAARDRVAESHRRFAAAQAAGAVYGATTGVGANRAVPAIDDPEDPGLHGRRLLRSHAAGVGPLEELGVTRAAMVVRLNQLLRGGSGISSAVVEALLEAIRHDALPALHHMGSIGTGDLTAMAELALTLAGERPWRTGGVDPVVFAPGDSLPFLSSSAVTIATAALATHETQVLLEATPIVTALSFLALQGSSESWDAHVTRGRDHSEQGAIAQRLFDLVSTVEGRQTAGMRIQDPFGLRVAPQVHAPAADAVARLARIVELEMNSSTENPLVTDDGVRHHGQFHLATLATATDAARLAVHPVSVLSAARVSLLMRPDMTGLPAFLAESSTSSGLMIAEYLVQDLLAEMRIGTTPVTSASISVSLGLEEHASFAPQSGRLLVDLQVRARTALAVEAVAAVRALRSAPNRIVGRRVEPAYTALADALDPSTADRPLGNDIERAAALLPTLAGLV